MNSHLYVLKHQINIKKMYVINIKTLLLDDFNNNPHLKYSLKIIVRILGTIKVKISRIFK